jgi:hypothetical protein
MLKYGKLLLTTAVALVAMFAVAGSASASEATVSPAGGIAAPSSGQLTFTGGSISIRCNVTLNGSLLRGPIRTESTSQIGEVTEVTIARETCSGGTVEGVLNVPWTMTLTQTLGTAPNAITGLLFTINNAQFLLSVFGGFIDCLYAGNAGALLALSAIARTSPQQYRTGTISALNSSLSLSSGGFGCPSSGSMTGTFTVTAQTITVS